MFSGDDQRVRDVMLNPFMLLSMAWVGITAFRLARAINPRLYFWLPVMAIMMLAPFVGIPFLFIKSSSIIARSKAQ